MTALRELLFQELPDRESERRRLFVGVCGVQRDVQLHALRAARLREAFEPEVLEHVADIERDLTALDDRGGRARVEIEHHHRRCLDVATARHRRVDLDRGQIGRPHKRRDLTDAAIVDAAAAIAGTAARLHPIGAMRRATLSKNDCSLTPLGHRRNVTPRSPMCSSSVGRRSARSSRSPVPW